jgi:predicted RNase H-like HicB family nuclease
MTPMRASKIEAGDVAVRYSVVLIWDEDGQVWVAEVPALDHAATSGETVEEALDMARELIALTIADMRAHGEPVPAGDIPVQVHTVDVSEADIASSVTIPHLASSAELKQH